MKQIHSKGHDIFKNAHNRRECSTKQKQEEQGSPNPASCHLCKDIGQRDENKSGTCGWLYIERKAGRYDDEPGHQSYKSVQDYDTQRFPCQRTGLVQVAAEDSHPAHSDT